MHKNIMLGAAAFGLSASAFSATNRPDGFTTLCKIDETCALSSSTQVAFGASGQFVYKTLNSNFICNAATFGTDPVPSKSVKECSISKNVSGEPDNNAGNDTDSEPSASDDSTLSSNQYVIINRHSGLAIDVAGNSAADGANILQSQVGDTDLPYWDVTSLGNGYYSIRSASSGQSIDVYEFSMEPGAEIRQWSYWGGDNQQWAVTPVGDGYFTITSKLNGLALDAWEWSKADQADIRQFTHLGAVNQQWRFATAGQTTPTDPVEPTDPTDPVEPPEPTDPPDRNADLEGFGAATTGGAGGQVVYASTGSQINQAMCSRASDDTPLIIMVNGTITHSNTSKVSGSCDTTDEEIQFKKVSNISLIGVGTKGILDQIGVHVRDASNIIIQNLHIKNVKKSGSPTSNGGDAIGMESGVNNVWIDHNTLEASGGESSGYDSLLDMKAGVTNVTVSYNWYRDSSRAGLVGSSDSDSANTNITFHHNWYQNIEQRTPLIRHGLAHIYNNYWSNPSQNYMFHAINSRMGARVLVEGNHFYNVNNPLLASDDSSEPGCWQTGENTVEPEIYYSRKVGDGALDVPEIAGGQLQSSCRVSVPYSYKLDHSSEVPGIVRANAGVGKI